ncbi:MAG: ABC transporter ATP-binding protein [Deltaproteobacteria bacterium]|nr:ABC transporter ATP-binding protein [Deltaproteobacteria bacterium]
MNDPIVELESATKVFGGVAAVNDVSLRIDAGEVIGLVGPNGSGKTTLMRLLCAYFPPTRGSVRVAGHDTRDARAEVRRRVGYAPQGVSLYPDLSVYDFLSFVASVKHAGPAQLGYVVERCGLGPRMQQRIDTLSKGYRQRVVLAQAMLGDSPVLLLDEPTMGLDPEAAIEVRAWIRSFRGNRTVVLTTHSLNEAIVLCDRILVLDRGSILAQGRPRDLFPGRVGVSTLEDELVRLFQSRSRAERVVTSLTVQSRMEDRP